MRCFRCCLIRIHPLSSIWRFVSCARPWNTLLQLELRAVVLTAAAAEVSFSSSLRFKRCANAPGCFDCKVVRCHPVRLIRRLFVSAGGLEQVGKSGNDFSMLPFRPAACACRFATVLGACVVPVKSIYACSLKLLLLENGIKERVCPFVVLARNISASHLPMCRFKSHRLSTSPKRIQYRCERRRRDMFPVLLNNPANGAIRLLKGARKP